MKKVNSHIIEFILAAIVLILVEPTASATTSKYEFPIGRHFKEATIINHARAPLYAKLTNGESLRLSYELITMENMGRLFTKHLDLKAQMYLDHGIGVFRDDLVEMSETPKFLEYFKDNLAPTEALKIPVAKIKKEWIQKIKDNDLENLYEDAVDLLEHGDLKAANQNCLTKHFVESIARSIMNLENHRKKSKELGLEDPKKLILTFLKIQIRSLPWAQSLDRRAFEIQRQNIPLFCQDVPAIFYK